MKLVTYCQSRTDWDLLKAGKPCEVILTPKALSRFGKLSFEECVQLANEMRELGFRTLLEWDLLMVESSWNSLRPNLTASFLANFSAVRVQDLGALNFLHKNFPEVLIQPILETSFHSYSAIAEIVEFLGESLDRVILSLEIPKEELSKILTKLTVPTELLGIGPLLLFYTPRSLLSAQFQNEDIRDRLLVGASQESPHKGFPLLENDRGTFMFNPKNHCLLENFNELQEFGLSHLRIDLRNKMEWYSLAAGLFSNYSRENVEKLKEGSGEKYLQGYYRVNKSDVLFKKLKNQRLIPMDQNYLGDILDVEKKAYIALHLNSSEKTIKIGDELEIKTPEGKSKVFRISEMMDANRQFLKEAKSGMVYFPHLSSISIRSKVFLREKT
ncbi:MAG: hypothetical protein HN509_06135 [Halobacteriovoraceae bacterium]|nr:hypothetical protein [Halobacteriovoraceae bacterium]MBT5094342.1 hypothetical protein [Halobacteriovoraceae bacterium]